MAALLSATAEKTFAWDLNMNSLFHVLNLAKAGKIKKIFWPSSIAVLDLQPLKKTHHNTHDHGPSTVYGISKQAGEDGASTTTISLRRCAAYDIPV
jgi:nucleoside-diphosphate-sugar epimerase